MGVDITHIIRHDFYDVQNLESAKGFVSDIIRQLKTNLYLDESEDAFDICIGSNDANEIRFRLPIYDWTFILHNGFWEIESGFHYCQIAMNYDGNYRLRELSYDIAKALGKEEMWYVEDWYTSNGGVTENYDCSFEELMDYIHKDYGRSIPEYNLLDFIKQGIGKFIPDYEPVYHDSFKECKERFDEKIKKYEDYGYKPIELTDIWSYARCVRKSDNTIHLVNTVTYKPLVSDVVDEFDYSFGSGILIAKINGKYAAYDLRNGCAISEYVSQPFRKEWSKKGNCDILINEEAGIRKYL